MFHLADDEGTGFALGVVCPGSAAAAECPLFDGDVERSFKTKIEFGRGVLDPHMQGNEPLCFVSSDDKSSSYKPKNVKNFVLQRYEKFRKLVLKWY